jgi:hypothetical protein
MRGYNYIDISQVRENNTDREKYFRHISKGAWPFSTIDHGWPISGMGEGGRREEGVGTRRDKEGQGGTRRDKEGQGGTRRDERGGKRRDKERRGRQHLILFFQIVPQKASCAPSKCPKKFPRAKNWQSPKTASSTP